MYVDTLFLLLGLALLSCGVVGCIRMRRRQREQNTQAQMAGHHFAEAPPAPAVAAAAPMPSSTYTSLGQPQMFTASVPLAAQGSQPLASWGLPLQQQQPHPHPQPQPHAVAVPQQPYIPPDDSVFVYGQAEYIPRIPDSAVVDGTTIPAKTTAKDV